VGNSFGFAPPQSARGKFGLALAWLAGYAFIGVLLFQGFVEMATLDAAARPAQTCPKAPK
jgi:hypothetical protein